MSLALRQLRRRAAERIASYARIDTRRGARGAVKSHGS